jgi:hypothetical protein
MQHKKALSSAALQNVQKCGGAVTGRENPALAAPARRGDVLNNRVSSRLLGAYGEHNACNSLVDLQILR